MGGIALVLLLSFYMMLGKSRLCLFQFPDLQNETVRVLIFRVILKIKQKYIC